MKDRNTISQVIESLFEDWIDRNINVHPLAVENMRMLEADAIALLKEHERLLTEYENISKVLFKIEKYFKISDLSSIVDGIENGTIVVLQDNGHYIGGTPITETTIKIRRM